MKLRNTSSDKYEHPTCTSVPKDEQIAKYAKKLIQLHENIAYYTPIIIKYIHVALKQYTDSVVHIVTGRL